MTKIVAKIKHRAAVPVVWLWLMTWVAGPPAIAQGGPGPTYVAMGSSFAAGPGVADRDPAAPPFCARSSSNYAHLLAAKRGLTLKDVSCSGSTTANILFDSQGGAPPEIEAVDRSTRLVTLTVGGNDVGYLGELVRLSCLDDPARTPETWRKLACRAAPQVDLEQGFSALPGRLLAIVAAIRARSPDATIVFVDYLAILPTKGACASRSPLTEAHIAHFNAVAGRLAAVTSNAAKSSGAILVKASGLSVGHDICAKDPWVAAYVLPDGLKNFGPAPYHPNLAGMTAISAALDAGVPLLRP